MSWTGKRLWARLAVLSALTFAWSFLAGCDSLGGGDDEDDDSSESKKKKKKSKKKSSDDEAEDDDDGEDDDDDGEDDENAAEAKGPVLTIAAGTLKAGHRCSDIPRITDEELVHKSISMGEFEIDKYPYPNDPNQAPKTNVTRDEAASLCEEQGKRLCTELEWERACKGPDNQTFEYGSAYKKASCEPTHALNLRPECKSPFEVMDMHGVTLEWTSSNWGRGDGADLATVRGTTKSDVVRERCAAGRGQNASNKSQDVGFRCCSGTRNAAEVDLVVDRQSPMVSEPSVEVGLASAMLRAMPKDHQTLPKDTPVRFDRVWRWHPRENEELIIGRWRGSPKGKRPFFELAVFKVCNGTPHRIARMRGPVEKLGDPGAGGDPARASASVSIGDDKGSVSLSYWYGSVKLTQPPWVKAGNFLSGESLAERVKGGDGVRKTRPKLLRR